MQSITFQVKIVKIVNDEKKTQKQEKIEDQKVDKFSQNIRKIIQKIM